MNIQLSDGMIKNLAARGLPRDIIRSRPFQLEQHVISIESQVEGIRARRVVKKRQLAYVERFLEKPFLGPIIFSISSFPNDGKAKQLAAYLFEAAYKAHLSGKFRGARSKQLPLWHSLTGSYYDHLRDKQELRPSLLVISNVTSQSTPVKVEKLRDLLEMYNDIPRIIVSTNEDPVTFANTKLLMPINYAAYLATARKVEI